QAPLRDAQIEHAPTSVNPVYGGFDLFEQLFRALDTLCWIPPHHDRDEVIEESVGGMSWKEIREMAAGFFRILFLVAVIHLAREKPVEDLAEGINIRGCGAGWGENLGVS